MFEVAGVVRVSPGCISRENLFRSIHSAHNGNSKSKGPASPNPLSISRQPGSRRADIRLARGFRIAKLRHRFAQQITEQHINERTAAATAARHDVRHQFDAGFRQRLWLAEINLFAAINNIY